MKPSNIGTGRVKKFLLPVKIKTESTKPLTSRLLGHRDVNWHTPNDCVKLNNKIVTSNNTSNFVNKTHKELTEILCKISKILVVYAT